MSQSRKVLDNPSPCSPVGQINGKLDVSKPPVRIMFIVPAVPVAQPRPRAVMAGKHARVHELTHTKGRDGISRPHPISAFKATVAAEFQSAYHGPPLAGPIVLRITFVMPRPSSKIWKAKPMPREPYTVHKNDWDNLGKAVCDALNKIAWRDDGQIYKATVERWVASGDEQPHVAVEIVERL